MSGPFDADVVAAVMRHMNTDHAADTLLITQVLGGIPDAVAARVSAITPDGATFEAGRPDGTTVEVLLPWSAPILERPQFRTEFAAMYHRST